MKPIKGQANNPFWDSDYWKNWTQEQNSAMNDLMGNIQGVGSALESAFSKTGNQFQSDLFQALNIALQIASIVGKMNSGEMSSTSGGLGILSFVH